MPIFRMGKSISKLNHPENPAFENIFQKGKTRKFLKNLT